MFENTPRQLRILCVTASFLTMVYNILCHRRYPSISINETSPNSWDGIQFILTSHRLHVTFFLFVNFIVGFRSIHLMTITSIPLLLLWFQCKVKDSQTNHGIRCFCHLRKSLIFSSLEQCMYLWLHNRKYCFKNLIRLWCKIWSDYDLRQNIFNGISLTFALPKFVSELKYLASPFKFGLSASPPAILQEI